MVTLEKLISLYYIEGGAKNKMVLKFQKDQSTQTVEIDKILISDKFGCGKKRLLIYVAMGCKINQNKFFLWIRIPKIDGYVRGFKNVCGIY